MAWAYRYAAAMFGALYGRVVLVLTLALLSVSALSCTALANPTCDSETPTLGSTVSCTYPDGGAFTLTVPANTIRIDVNVRGGGGGAGGTTVSYPGYRGGWGAQVEASLLPSSSTALTIVVGNGGQPKGDLQGGTGGEFSAVYEGPTRNAASVIVVAGGGGGGGYGTRCVYGGAGGQGGTDGAGVGGDAPGSGGGGSGGAGGPGGVVPALLTGIPGLIGSAWSSGGAGGTGGTARGGNGGNGYGGGGGGGFVDTASPITCQGATGDAVAANDGSGGGAGGSFANADRLIRDTTASFSSAGGSGGGGTGSYWYPYGMNGTVTLTFVGTTYTVTYDANGATGGSAPTDYFGPYLESTIVTVCNDHRTDLNCDFPNAERMTRDGYTFDGWNTARDGSGTSYAPTNTFAIGANTVLYAQWKALPLALNTLAAQNTPVATPALRTTRPKTTATGVTVTFTAPGPGTATASGTASQATRAIVTVCRGTTKILKAGKAVVTCKLNATGRRLRAKGALTVTLTTTFVAKTSSRLQAAHTVVLPRRG